MPSPTAPSGAVPVATSDGPGGTVPASTSAWHLVALAGILVLAAVLRLHGLGTDSFWHDEVWTLEMSQGRDARQMLLPRSGLLVHPPDLSSPTDAVGVGQLWTHMRLDNHPPLYVLLARLWIDRFGSGEAAVRSLSVVMSLVAIAALFDAARLTVGPTAAVTACLLMAVAVPQVQYAQEARDYATLLAEGTVALAAMARLWRCGPTLGRSVLLGGAVCTMALTHYFAAGAIAALTLYGLVALRGNARRAAVAAVAVAVMLGAVLWGHGFWLQRANFGGQRVAWLHETAPHPTVLLVRRVLLLPARYLVDTVGRARHVAFVVALVYVLPVPALLRRPALLLWWAWLVAVVGTVAALDAARSTWEVELVRYTLLASPAVYVLLAAAGQYIGRRGGTVSRYAGWIVPAAALAASAAALPTLAYHPVWRPDWRGLGRAIAAGRQPTEVVCCVGPGTGDAWQWNTDELYLPLTYYLRPMPAPVVLMRDVPPQSANFADDFVPPPTTLPSLAAYPGAWAIVSASSHAIAWPPREWRIASSREFYGIGTLQHLLPERKP